MDVLKCSILAALEAFVITTIAGHRHINGFTGVKTGSILFAIQYLLLKYYRIFLYHKYFSPLRHIPGPTDGHFFFGQSIKLLRAETPNSLYLKWVREHPDAPLIRYLSFANAEVLVPTSVETCKEILQTQCYSFKKPPGWRRMTKEIAGDGVIIMEFDQHRIHRKMLNSSFSLPNIRKLEPLFKSKAMEVGQVFDQAIAANASGKTGVVNCTECLSKATLDIMGMTILGTDLGNLRTTMLDSSSKDDHDEDASFGFHKAYHTIFEQGKLGQFLTFASVYIPTRWLPLQANRNYLHAASWLDNYLTQLVRRRYAEVRAAMDSGKYERSSSRDLLTFLIEESAPGAPAENIKESEVVGHLLQFMIAGHETSANMLCWSLYIMAEQPDIQSKLRAELMGIDGDPVFSDLDKLPYLDNFVKESLRAYPPVIIIPRETAHALTLADVRVPARTALDVVCAVLMQHPGIWGPDAGAADPDRWDRLAADQLSPYAFAAFSHGPRICPGKALATMEIKIMLALIVRRFRVVGVEKGFRVQNPAFSLRPVGLRVRFERVGV